jgi:hypothetical protein
MAGLCDGCGTVWHALSSTSFDDAFIALPALAYLTRLALPGAHGAHRALGIWHARNTNADYHCVVVAREVSLRDFLAFFAQVKRGS